MFKLMTAVSLVVAATQVVPVTWSAATPKAPAARGSQVVVALTAKLDDGWHLYSTTQPAGGPIATRISITASPMFASAGALSFPKPSVALDPNFNIDVETYERTVTFSVPVRIAATAKPGVDTLAIAARYQACNATLCLPPHTTSVAVPITVR